MGKYYISRQSVSNNPLQHESWVDTILDVIDPTSTTAYSQRLYDEGYPDGIDAHWWNSSRCWYIAQQLKRLKLVNTRILEIGCGRGAVVKGLAEYGIEIRGVELADVRPLREVSSRVLTNTDAAALTEEERSSVDTILLLDVIEHVENAEHFIQDIIKHFPSAHKLVISVPACDELWSNFDEHYGHFRRYDLSMLQKLGQDLRYTLLINQYFFHLLYIPARCMSALNIKRGLILQPPQGCFQKMLHRFFALLMRLDHLWIYRRLKGSSAIAVLDISNSARNPPL